MVCIVFLNLHWVLTRTIGERSKHAESQDIVLLLRPQEVPMHISTINLLRGRTGAELEHVAKITVETT